MVYNLQRYYDTYREHINNMYTYAYLHAYDYSGKVMLRPHLSPVLGSRFQTPAFFPNSTTIGRTYSLLLTSPRCSLIIVVKHRELMVDIVAEADTNIPTYTDTDVQIRRQTDGAEKRNRQSDGRSGGRSDHVVLKDK